MKISVLGATGGTGLQVVKQAIEKGDEVTVMVRNEQKLKESLGDALMEKVKLVAGSIEKQEDIDKLIQGQDVLVNSLGAFSSICSDSQKLINIALQKQPSTRYVAVTSFGCNESYQHANWNKKSKKLPENVNWTVVRPVGLTNDEGQQKVMAVVDAPPPSNRVPRSDVAWFILNEVLGKNSYVKKFVTISS